MGLYEDCFKFCLNVIFSNLIMLKKNYRQNKLRIIYEFIAFCNSNSESRLHIGYLSGMQNKTVMHVNCSYAMNFLFLCV